jgi:hypothetical protein
MTAGSGDPGENLNNEGQQPLSGAYEPPPIEQTPAYGGYPPPPPPPPPGYAGFPAPGGYEPAPTGGYNAPYGGSYPPPQGGYAPGPEYGAPYPTGYDYPAAQQSGTNSLAIFSLVASVVGAVPFCGFIFSIIGIVLGAVAINQIKRTRQGGYGLAVAGIIVGVATLAVGLIITTYAFN